MSPEDRDSGSYSEEGSDTYTTIEEVILPPHGATRRQLEDLAECEYICNIQNTRKTTSGNP